MTKPLTRFSSSFIISEIVSFCHDCDCNYGASWPRGGRTAFVARQRVRRGRRARADSAVDSIIREKYTGTMLSRSTLTITFGALAILGLSACKTAYSDTFSFRKNSFKAPVAKIPEIKAQALPILPEAAAMGGVLPPGAGGIPGAAAPDGAAIPGIPGAAPAVPGVPPAIPAL